MKCIMAIIYEIDQKTVSGEIEMHGVDLYPAYSKQDLALIQTQQMLKNALKSMLIKMANARPEVNDPRINRMIQRMK